MEQKVRHTGPLASKIPALPEIQDRFRSPSEKIIASPRLNRNKFRHVTVDRDGYGFRLSILAASLHPNGIGREIDLRPSDAQQRSPS